MSADGELYVDEICRDKFKDKLDKWYGVEKWGLYSNEFGGWWDMSEFPDKIKVKVVNQDRNAPKRMIGVVEITNKFIVINEGYGRYVDIEPKSIRKVR